MRNLGVFALFIVLTLVFSTVSLAEEGAEAAPEGTVVVMETSMGTIEIVLYDKAAPITVKNFLAYVDEGHYDGTIFHRVIRGFMIQGGGFDPSMKRKETRAPIKNEAENGKRNVKGTIAMARTSVVDSATDQFYINTVDNPNLNNKPGSFGYAVFGEVISGMEIAKKIEYTQTARGDKPVEDIVIRSVKRK